MQKLDWHFLWPLCKDIKVRFHPQISPNESNIHKYAASHYIETVEFGKITQMASFSTMFKIVLSWKKLFYAFYCENIGCKLLAKVEKFHFGVTWSLSISEADRPIQTTVALRTKDS